MEAERQPGERSQRARELVSWNLRAGQEDAAAGNAVWQYFPIAHDVARQRAGNTGADFERLQAAGWDALLQTERFVEIVVAQLAELDEILTEPDARGLSCERAVEILLAHVAGPGEDLAQQT